MSIKFQLWCMHMYHQSFKRILIILKLYYLVTCYIYVSLMLCELVWYFYFLFDSFSTCVFYEWDLSFFFCQKNMPTLASVISCISVGKQVPFRSCSHCLDSLHIKTVGIGMFPCCTTILQCSLNKDPRPGALCKRLLWNKNILKEINDYKQTNDCD